MNISIENFGNPAEKMWMEGQGSKRIERLRKTIQRENFSPETNEI